MKFTSASLALAAGSSVAASACSFTLTASGGQSGIVGQLDDGQNRVGGGHPTGSYSISKGGLTDAHGRGCILTPPSSQFQCDVGATPTGGFSIGSNGQVNHNGSPTFYACPATDSEYNIYTVPVPNQLKCVEIGLTASGCYTNTTTSSYPTAYSSSYWKNSTTSTVTVGKSTPATKTKTKTATQSKSQSAPANTETTIQQPQSPQTVYITQVVTQPVQTVTVTSIPAYCASAPSGPVIVSQISDQQGQAPTGTPSTGGSAPQSTTEIIVPPVHSVTPVSPSTGKSTVVPPPQSVTTISSVAPYPTSNSTLPTHPGTSTGPRPTGKTCPGYLPAAYEYPHLIIPVSKSSPNTTYGTSYFGKINSDVSSIFNFDVPAGYTGTCSLVFLFPEQSQLETSSYSFSGNGAIDFAQLSNVATQQTSYTSTPSVKTDFGVKTITPGSATTISSFQCPSGQAISIKLSSVSGTSFSYFQDYNPCPIGLYLIGS